MADKRLENPNNLLIIDDEKNMRHMLSALLARHGYKVDSAVSALEALEIVKRKEYEFILCDVKMPEVDGLQFLLRGKDDISNSTVIMMSAYGSVETALDAMKAGAYDFISKPFKTDEVLLALRKAEEREMLKAENRQLRKTIEEIQNPAGFTSIVGKSKKIQAVIQLARKISLYDTTVLITGESGTGKELLARGIHSESERGTKQFYAINCGSIPNELLESELFGYLKGAFTGADKDKIGILEAANGSTLFLDEIGEMPMTMQVKLLRVLQENEIRPLGATATRNISVRILAATSKALEEEVKNGKFREDLFYRLNVLALHMPALRRRKDDIPLLCNHFLNKYNKKFVTNIRFSGSTDMEKLLKYKWPGNVRELENIIQRGMVFAEEERFELGLLPDRLTVDHQYSDLRTFETDYSLKKAQKKLEAKMIHQALNKTAGNKSKAARLLEISYPSLLNKIKEYKLNEKDDGI